MLESIRLARIACEDMVRAKDLISNAISLLVRANLIEEANKLRAISALLRSFHNELDQSVKEPF